MPTAHTERPRPHSPDPRGSSVDQIRVVLISAHPLFREGLAQALRAASDIVLVESLRAADARTAASERLADVVLVDVDSAAKATVDIALAVARDFPNLRIVLLAGSEAASDAAAALEAGVGGYVLKTVGGSELVEIVRVIHQGATYIAPQLGANAILQWASRRSAENSPGRLTRREEDILAHVCRGLSNKEIARTLRIAEKTVKHYMGIIMKKLGARNRVEVALSRETAPARRDGAETT